LRDTSGPLEAWEDHAAGPLARVSQSSIAGSTATLMTMLDSASTSFVINLMLAYISLLQVLIAYVARQDLNQCRSAI